MRHEKTTVLNYRQGRKTLFSQKFVRTVEYKEFYFSRVCVFQHNKLDSLHLTTFCAVFFYFLQISSILFISTYISLLINFRDIYSPMKKFPPKWKTCSRVKNYSYATHMQMQLV